jgi:type I restriction enzyme S subunit
MTNYKNVPVLRFKEFKGEWEVKKIRDIAKVSSGGTPSRSKQNYWKGNIPWITTSLVDFNIITKAEENITEEGLNNSSAKLFPKETILMAMYGQGKTRGKVAILGIEATTNQACAAIIADSSTHNLYLYQNLASRYGEIRKLSNEGGQKNLSGGLIKGLKIPIPTKPEQQKIANFLTATDTKIQQLRKKKGLLNDYKKGVMQQIFKQEIRFKNDDGGDFEDWEVKRLEEVAIYRRGSFPQPYGLSKWYDDENGSPFVQVYDVDNNMKLKENTKRRISKAAGKMSVFVEKGTIVLTIQGSIGRIAITQYDTYVDRTLLIFQEYLYPIDKVFFAYIIHLLFEIEKTKAPGGTIKTITKEKLSKFKILLPQLEEQQKIANFLSSIDERIGKVLEEIGEMERYKKGLLQGMFV